MLKIKNYSKSGRTKPYKQGKGGAGRVVRNVIISAFILLVLFTGAGIIYTWYIGKNSVPIEVPEITRTAAQTHQTKKPFQPADDARLGISVQYMTKEVMIGQNASVTIRTNAAANCVITFIYNNIASKDSGLAPKVADEYGMVTWTWTVGADVPVGKWPAKAVCGNKKYSGMIDRDIDVKKP